MRRAFPLVFFALLACRLAGAPALVLNPSPKLMTVSPEPGMTTCMYTFDLPGLFVSIPFIFESPMSFTLWMWHFT